MLEETVEQSKREVVSQAFHAKDDKGAMTVIKNNIPNERNVVNSSESPRLGKTWFDRDPYCGGTGPQGNADAKPSNTSDIASRL